MLPQLQEKHQVGLLALGLLFLFGRRATSYELVLGIAAMGFLGSYLVQMKGWSYHGYPFFALFFVLILLAAALAGSESNASNLRRTIIAAVVLVFFVTQSRTVIDWYGLNNTKSGPVAYQQRQVMDLVEKYASGRAFYAFSTHPYPAFPTTNYTSAKWGGRFNSQFIVPALVKQEESGKSLTPRLRRAESYLRRAVLQDFQSNKPQLVLIDARSYRHGIGSVPFDDIAFYTRDPAFARIWAQYTELEPVAGFRAFRRR